MLVGVPIKCPSKEQNRGWAQSGYARPYRRLGRRELHQLVGNREELLIMLLTFFFSCLISLSRLKKSGHAQPLFFS